MVLTKTRLLKHDFPVHGNVAAAPAQKLFYEFFCPKNLVHPILSLRTEGVFRGLSVREQRKSRVGARRGVLILQHESGPEFYWKLARILSHILSRILPRILSRNPPEFFQTFFPARKKTTPNPGHLRGQNPRQFWKLFSQWFLWVLDTGLRRCFWMPVCLC